MLMLHCPLAFVCVLHLAAFVCEHIVNSKYISSLSARFTLHHFQLRRQMFVRLQSSNRKYISGCGFMLHNRSVTQDKFKTRPFIKRNPRLLNALQNPAFICSNWFGFNSRLLLKISPKQCWVSHIQVTIKCFICFIPISDQ